MINSVIESLGDGPPPGLTIERFSDIVGQVYECALEPERWGDALASVCEGIGGSAGWIGTHQPKLVRSDYENCPLFPCLCLGVHFTTLHARNAQTLVPDSMHPEPLCVPVFVSRCFETTTQKGSSSSGVQGAPTAAPQRGPRDAKAQDHHRPRRRLGNRLRQGRIAIVKARLGG